MLGVAALVNTDTFIKLVWAGGLFAGSLTFGLLSLRLSADGLRKLSENANLKTDNVGQFTAVSILNWLAIGALVSAFIMLAVFVGTDAMPKVGAEG